MELKLGLCMEPWASRVAAAQLWDHNQIQPNPTSPIDLCNEEEMAETALLPNLSSILVLRAFHDCICASQSPAHKGSNGMQSHC